MAIETERLGHRPELDGLRAFAVVIVVLYHFSAAFSGRVPIAGGWLGVFVFFVLSGFLITRLLLEERWTDGHVSLRRFYRRRIARLAPAYFTVR